MKKTRCCPKCDSSYIAMRQLSLATDGVNQEYVCVDCGYQEHYYTEPKLWLDYLQEKGVTVWWLNTPPGQGPYR